MEISSEITIGADGVVTERYILDGAEISRDEYFEIQFAALVKAIEDQG